MDAVYFTATWCQPCKVFGPIMEKLNDAVTVHKFDIEQNMELVQRFGILSVPTVVFLKENQELGRLVGARTEQQVRDYIAELE